MPDDVRRPHNLSEAAGDLPADIPTRVGIPLTVHVGDGEKLANDGTPTVFASDRVAAAASPDQLGGELGRYELLEKIGRGGMGTVYRARDNALQRDVAVKILHESYGPDSRTSMRFIEEARIAGQLQHPGIPAVHQVGRLADGRPFLAMKLIKGSTLDTLIKDNEPLNTLAIFEAICQAVGFAHAHRVIHRDLKPANIMVGSFGEVQVMDWGLAKVLTAGPDVKQTTLGTSASTEIRSIRDSDGSFTQAGSVMGTPAYMAPEQAGSEQEKIDTRSDVFGLGAVLCCLLTGKPPYDGGDADSIHLNAVRGLTSEAFTRLDRCAADPEIIALCKRCMAFDPTDRPFDGGTVAAAVAAIRLAADERARQAERDKALAEVQAAEQRKRRRIRAALLSLAAVLLVGASAVTWWADREAKEKRDRQARNVEAIEYLLLQAEAALRDDDPAAAEVPVAQADKRAAEGGAEYLRPRVDRCKKDLAMLKELDRIDRYRWTLVNNKAPELEEVSAERAAAFGQFGIRLDNTDPAEAAKLIDESIIRDRLLTALDAWLLESLSPQVLAIVKATDADAFRNAFRDAIQANRFDEQIGLANRTDTIRQPMRFLMAMGRLHALPADQRERFLRAAFQHQPRNLTVLMDLGHLMLNQPERAAGWYRAALAARANNATIWNNLGYVTYMARDWEGAIAAYREVVRLEPHNANGYNGLGAALYERGDLDEAAASYREGIRLDAKNAIAHGGLSGILCSKNDLERALKEADLAIQIDPEQPFPHYQRGRILYQQANLDGAIAAFRETIRLDRDYPWAYRDLGEMFVEKSDWDGALSAFKEAVRVAPTDAMAHNGLSVALCNKLDFDGAIAESKVAIGLDPTNALLHLNLGFAYAGKREWSAALAAQKEAIRLDPNLFKAHANLGFILQETRDHVRACDSYREAIRIEPDNALGHAGLGESLRLLNDLPGALTSYTEAARLNPKYGYAHNGMGLVLKAMGDLDRAIASFRQAIKAEPRWWMPMDNLGHALLAKKDFVGAATAFADAGDALRNNSNADSAIDKYERAIEANPKYARAYYGVGLAFEASKSGRRLEAIGAYREAVRVDPTFVPAHLSLGDAQLRDNDNVAASVTYRKAIALDAKNTWAYQGLGHALFRMKDLKGSADAYQRAIEYDPSLIAARNDLGAVLLRLNEVDRAIHEFREAACRSPSDVDSYRNLGDALMQKKDYLAASAAYRDAIRCQPTNAHLHDKHGGALTFAGDFEGAIAAYRRAVELDASNALRHSNLGDAYRQDDDLDAAETSYREAVRLNSDLLHPIEALASIHLDRNDQTKAAAAFVQAGVALRNSGNRAAAIARFHRAIELNPGSKLAYFQLGFLLGQTVDLDAAEAAYRRSIELDPNYMLAHNNLGHVLQQKLDLDGAIASYQEAIRVEPNATLPRTNLGNVLRLKGDLPGSIAVYREALRIDPRIDRARNGLAIALCQTGRLAEAREELSSGAKKGDPSFGPSSGLLGTIHSMLALEKRQAGFMLSGARPLNVSDAALRADWCAYHQHYTEAVAIYAEAFARNPKLADNSSNSYRYNAACCAALAADGKGREPPLLSERPEYRRQARTWLEAQFAQRKRSFEANENSARTQTRKDLEEWLLDADLASIRNPARLRELHPDEQALFERFWRDVRALHRRAAPPELVPAPREAPAVE